MNLKGNTSLCLRCWILWRTRWPWVCWAFWLTVNIKPSHINQIKTTGIHGERGCDEQSDSLVLATSVCVCESVDHFLCLGWKLKGKITSGVPQCEEQHCIFPLHYIGKMRWLSGWKTERVGAVSWDAGDTSLPQTNHVLLTREMNQFVMQLSVRQQVWDTCLFFWLWGVQIQCRTHNKQGY